MVHRIGNRLLVTACSDVGRVRTLNEDAFLIDEGLGLLTIADGMGGHDAGEVASNLVVETMRAALRAFPDAEPDPNRPISHPGPTGSMTPGDEPTVDDAPNPVLSMIHAAINRANVAVNTHNVARGYPEGMGMGSTLVGLWLPEYTPRPVIFHVGDSRLYLFTQGELRLRTQDHSMYQQWVNFGSRGQAPAQNILLQAMGPSNVVSPDVTFQDIASGEILLLCSDGLSSMVRTERIAAVLRKTSAENLEESCQQLIELALRAGGKDNITVMLGFVL
ncbi:MAG: protein phosphatase 2C domain-containing protein [Magnetococcus sp. YQC-9]